ncbi:MAG: CinA family protein [Pseudomonadota bacterium]
MNAVVFLPPQQVMAAPLAQRLAARLRLAGAACRIELTAQLPMPHEGAWHIALGEFPGLGCWLDGKAMKIALSPLDWPAVQAFCDAHFPLREPVYTVLADRCKAGQAVLPGEFWSMAPLSGALALQAAPPEWALGQALLAARARLAVAESCTGGGLAARLTDLPGSSAYFDRGFVTYSNAAKIALLDVREETLARTGAVSEATALEMLRGALGHGDLAVAITGIAGPGGATPGKPVGTVCIAWGRRGGAVAADTFHFPGDRLAVRHAAGSVALGRLLELLHGRPG